MLTLPMTITLANRCETLNDDTTSPMEKLELEMEMKVCDFFVEDRPQVYLGKVQKLGVFISKD
jgi:hypothetical protein